MLSSKESMAHTLKEISQNTIEMNIPQVVNNLRWTVSEIAELGRKATDPMDKDNYISQMENLFECMTWLSNIKDAVDSHGILKGGNHDH